MNARAIEVIGAIMLTLSIAVILEGVSQKDVGKLYVLKGEKWVHSSD